MGDIGKRVAPRRIYERPSEDAPIAEPVPSEEPLPEREPVAVPA